MAPSRHCPGLASLLMTFLVSSRRSASPPQWCVAAQRADPTEFNGGSVLAMSGRNSVAIAVDSRFGLGMQTISASGGGDYDENDGASGYPAGGGRVSLLPGTDAVLAWTGLRGDGIGFSGEVDLVMGRRVRRSGRMGFPCFERNASPRAKMGPRAVASLVSHLLYRRRDSPYYVETVVAGLEKVHAPVKPSGIQRGRDDRFSGKDTKLLDTVQSVVEAPSLNARKIIATPPMETPITKPLTQRRSLRPYICSTDMLGARSTSESFVCTGVAAKSLHGTAEALWRPDMDGDDLVEACGRAFLGALERDCLSGYGATVYLIQEDEDGRGRVRITEYILSCRND